MIDLEKNLSQKIIYQENKTEENNDCSTLKNNTNTDSTQQTNSKIEKEQRLEENKTKIKKNKQIEKMKLINKIKKLYLNEGWTQNIYAFKKELSKIFKNLSLSLTTSKKSYLFHDSENKPFIKNQSIEMKNDMFKLNKIFDINLNSKIYNFYEQRIEKDVVNLKSNYSSVFS